MEKEKQELVITPVPIGADVAAAFARLLEPKYDTGGGLCDVADLLAESQAFEVTAGAELVGHYALRVDRRAHGEEGVIIGAVGRDLGGEGMRPYLTRRLLQLAEAQFINARAVTIYTRRLGMVRELARQGYTCDGFIMRKRVKVHSC